MLRITHDENQDELILVLIDEDKTVATLTARQNPALFDAILDFVQSWDHYRMNGHYTIYES